MFLWKKMAGISTNEIQKIKIFLGCVKTEFSTTEFQKFIKIKLYNLSNSLAFIVYAYRSHCSCMTYEHNERRFQRDNHWYPIHENNNKYFCKALKKTLNENIKFDTKFVFYVGHSEFRCTWTIPTCIIAIGWRTTVQWNYYFFSQIFEVCTLPDRSTPQSIPNFLLNKTKFEELSIFRFKISDAELQCTWTITRFFGSGGSWDNDGRHIAKWKYYFFLAKIWNLHFQCSMPLSILNFVLNQTYTYL